MVLYLLKIKNLPIFKIGITRELYKRVKALCNLYPIDLNDSFIVSSVNIKYLIALEKLLISEYEQRQPKYENINGCTELVDGLEILNQLEKIKEEKPLLKIEISKVTLEKPKKEKRPVVKDRVINSSQLRENLREYLNSVTEDSPLYVFRGNKKSLLIISAKPKK